MDPSALLREITDDLRMAHGNKDVSLIVDIAPELPQVHADKDMIAQVMSNLLDNALRFTRDRIQVRAVRAGDEIVVSVIDDGRGIPEGKAAISSTSSCSSIAPKAAQVIKARD